MVEIDILKELTNFYTNKRVFITGHTGFKGSWLSILLTKLGAEISGFALPPPTNPSLFKDAKIANYIKSNIGDIRNLDHLVKSMKTSKPEIIFHLAAQPLVRESYLDPIATYSINVMGTVNLLQSIRNVPGIKSIVNVTTDKCYDNKEWVWGYREDDDLGGYDPYSNSKACSELVTSSFRHSFFNPEKYESHGVALASARAGNVIGGGDWASDRLLPDIIRAKLSKHKVILRNPNAIRPWQHVIEPLVGYLILAMKLNQEGPEYSGAWNFGPKSDDDRTVEWICNKLSCNWNIQFEIDNDRHPHETNYLKLDCSKAMTRLKWSPKWNIDKTLEAVVDWVDQYEIGSNPFILCSNQIDNYFKC